MNFQSNSIVRVTASTVAFAVIAMLTSSVAQATSIWNVDLNSSNGVASGAAVVGSAGDYWNVANTSDVDTNLNIVDSSGVSGGSDITLKFSAPGGNVFGFNPVGAPNPAELMDGFGSSVNGGGGSAFAQLSFAFSGLVPNTQYTVYGYGASQDGTDRGTYFFGPVNSLILGVTSGASTDIAAGNQVAWDDFVMTTDASGAFTINTNFNSGTSAQGPVNGFQVVGPAPVPEPASICLVAMSGLILLGFRKRQS
jgi:hypothetical protein